MFLGKRKAQEMTKTEHYRWVEGKTLPVLDVHSLAKHEVLEQYLFQYVKILSSQPGIPELRLNLIDGFSGGGVYAASDDPKKILFGSPLIFLNTTKAVEDSINLERTKPFLLNTKFYFIDKEKDFISFLKNRIIENGFGKLIEDERCVLLTGEFSEKLDNIIADINSRGRGRRSIFLLDQYGYIDVTTQLINKILNSLPRSEIIVTFAAEKLVDFYNKSKKYLAMMRGMGIDPSNCDVMSDRGQMVWRYQMQSWIADEIHKESGAKFLTRFFIKSRKSNRAYWLLHFSNHLRAHEEMVSIHWRVQNHFAHYGKAGLNAFPILGFDPDRVGINEFDFGADAKSLSVEALAGELPQFVHQYRDGITVRELRLKTANHTPTDMGICREVLGSLADEKEFIIKTKNGGERRKFGRIGMDDIILPNQQMRFDLKPRNK